MTAFPSLQLALSRALHPWQMGSRAGREQEGRGVMGQGGVSS